MRTVARVGHGLGRLLPVFWAQAENLHSGQDILRALDARFGAGAVSYGPYFFPDLAGTTEDDEQAASTTARYRRAAFNTQVAAHRMTCRSPFRRPYHATQPFSFAAPRAFVVVLSPGQVARRMWYSYADSRLMAIRSPGWRP